LSWWQSAAFPVERRFWFDPPFNPGRRCCTSSPTTFWRIDLQLGGDIDKVRESKPENVMPRLRAFLGEDAKFELEWVSIYACSEARLESATRRKKPLAPARPS
jgi:3-(3-hydroxy-phenyl)propionate hydroxylase